MSRKDQHGAGDAAMRHGNSNGGGCRNCTRHAGDDLARDAGVSEGQGLLAAATEDERIATLQADNAATAARGANHDSMNRLLRDGWPARALADEEPLCATRVA